MQSIGCLITDYDDYDYDYDLYEFDEYYYDENHIENTITDAVVNICQYSPIDAQIVAEQ